MKGLVVEDKATRVHQFQHKTVEAASEIMGSMGLTSPTQLTRKHLLKRITAQRVLPYSELYPEVVSGCLLDGSAPPAISRLWSAGGSIFARFE